MKPEHTAFIVPGLVTLLVVTLIISCNKNFTDKPLQGYADQRILANKTGVEALLIGAYSLLDGNGGNNGGWYAAASNWVYGSICADDAYMGSTPSDQSDLIQLEQWQESAKNNISSSKWDEDFDGLQRCNAVLREMRLAHDLTPPIRL